MEKLKNGMGPFRATRLWNEIVSDFRSGMPSKRQRWKMRFYDDSFLSSDAIDWLHAYLQGNENYGPWVTREQAIQLLHKFVQSKVIESVKPYKGVTKDVFEESGGLYRLVHMSGMSPMKKLRSALRSRDNLRPLTPSPKRARSRAPMRPLSLNANLGMDNLAALDMIKSKLSFGGSTKNLKAVGPSQGNTKDPKAVGPAQRRRQSKPGLLKRSRSMGAVEKPAPRPNSTSSMFYVPPAVKVVPSSGKDLSPEERIEAVWKNALLTRLKSLLWLFTLEGVLDENAFRGSDILYNSTQLTRTGVVALKDKSQDLPQWVLSAMKCIANWPQRQESDLPNYPGFEKDVFQTVSDYFQKLDEPLMTFDLYNLVTQAYELGLKRDNDRMNPPGKTNPVLGKDVQPTLRLPEKLLQKSQSVEKIPRSPSTRGSNNCGRGQERVFCITQCRRTITSNTSTKEVNDNQQLGKEGTSLKPESNLASYPPKSRIGRAQSMRVQPVSVGTANVTTSLESSDFLSNGRPKSFAGGAVDEGTEMMAASSQSGNEEITPSSSSTSMVGTHDHQSAKSCSDLSHDGSKQGGRFIRNGSKRSLRLSKRFGSASDLINRLVRRKNPKGYSTNGSMPDIISTVIAEENEDTTNGTLSSRDLPSFSPLLASSVSLQDVNSQRRSERNSDAVSPPYPAPLRATLSVSEIVKSSEGEDHPDSLYSRDAQSSISGDRFLQGKSVSSIELRITPPAVPAPTKKRIAVSTKGVPRLQLESDKSYCEEALRLALLLLPPPNRRKLHLLMKMMNKIERNDQLDLGEDKRQLLLHTFSRCILCTVSEVDYDEAYASRIVAYLLDHFSTILVPSVALRVHVDKELSSRPELQVSPTYSSSVAYCKQVTKEEYLVDAESSSLKALADLLETIITDQNMDTKEKKKRLKGFQQAYPQIYRKRLPTAASEAELFPARPKIKQPMLKKSFTRLKPIR